MMISLFIVFLCLSAGYYLYYLIKQKTVIVYLIIMTFIMLLIGHLLLDKYGFNHHYICYLLITLLLTFLSAIDLQKKRIPLDVVLCFTIIGVIVIINDPNTKIMFQLLRAFIVFFILFILSKATKEGFGLGDVYVLSSISIIVGWKIATTLFFIGILMCGITGLFLILFKKVYKKTQLPFIPFLLIGFIIIVII